ncbi:H(+)/Cl(-) exchange transporter 7 isoform X4 [Schistocerca gregaria]|uniref:H(+)/Cl(-) exchange transporter 7 isoform X4 n=1 Tax=Schistocerca gregaria TaxID=7010 RepID=UPI00211F19B2|nr:H(+)/Cl(-) exchange transporter 7 isoform X4 [Schistocerca gregaria]
MERRRLLCDNGSASYGTVAESSEEPLLINADISESRETEGRTCWRKCRPTGGLEIGTLKVLSAKFESLDYDICENYLLLDEERRKGYKFVVKKNVARWIIFFLIGILTAFIGCSVDVAVEELSDIKYSYMKSYVDKCVWNYCLYIPFLIWIASNIIPVVIGSILVAYVEPTAAGSGIPQVKCYLNGIKIPRVVRIKTLLVKVIGVVCSVVGGLAAGKEGPMIHSGAVVAAGISQGKSTTLRQDFNILQYFREDHEKRDFVCGGAAAGVAAAFGAPVGGVLFSLEEGSSFWNQSLTWRIFFASMVSAFTLNVVLSTYHGHPGELTYSGLLNFGKFENISYEMTELLIFVVMGIIGGLLGSLFNHINYKLTVFRMRYLPYKSLKVVEAAIVAMFTATVGFLMIYLINDCKPLGQDPTKHPMTGTIDPGKYAVIGAAAQLGGVVRMTISLTVILIEATGNITFGLPLMLTLITAKWFGDFFNEGIYDIHIQICGVPILPWEPPPLSNNIYASEVMSHPVVTLKTIENVGHIVDVLKSEEHNGFPVVDPEFSKEGNSRSCGTLRGMILRSQLIVILKNKLFNESSEIWNFKELPIKLFRDAYPRYESIDEVSLSETERTFSVDLRPFMNQSPYTVQHSASLPRVFRLFRALGLRHLPVVNDANEVVGMVTRKDLARYRVWKHRGNMGLDELVISEKI